MQLLGDWCRGYSGPGLPLLNSFAALDFYQVRHIHVAAPQAQGDLGHFPERLQIQVAPRHLLNISADVQANYFSLSAPPAYM